ncbi:MAG: hypothetical protein ACLQVI_25315 [Polyangiaceae bacterium]
MTYRTLSLAPFVFLAACTSNTSSGGNNNNNNNNNTTSFNGVYSATFSGTYQNTSPNNDTGSTTSSATITVTTVSASEIELSWQIAPNPPSGTAIFAMSGSSGALVDAGAPVVSEDAGTIVGGSCFTGTVNGNTQTNCCTNCTVSFSGSTFTQPNSGTYAGRTPQGVAYTGTYSGTWTGTLQ